EELNASGEVFGSAALVVPPSSSGGSSTPFTIDASTSVVGTGQNFFGWAEREIYLRSSTGQVVVEEINNLFNGTSQVIGSAGLILTTGALFTIDSSTTI